MHQERDLSFDKSYYVLLQLLMCYITVHQDLRNTRKFAIHSEDKVERRSKERIQLQCVGEVLLRKVNHLTFLCS